jgi:hypothetical protein
VPMRVAALLGAAPRPHPLAGAVLVGLVAAAAFAALLLAHDVDRLFDAAAHAYLAQHSRAR